MRAYGKSLLRWEGAVRVAAPAEADWGLSDQDSQQEWHGVWGDSEGKGRSGVRAGGRPLFCLDFRWSSLHTVWCPEEGACKGEGNPLSSAFSRSEQSQGAAGDGQWWEPAALPWWKERHRIDELEMEMDRWGSFWKGWLKHLDIGQEEVRGWSRQVYGHRGKSQGRAMLRIEIRGPGRWMLISTWHRLYVNKVCTDRYCEISLLINSFKPWLSSPPPGISLALEVLAFCPVDDPDALCSFLQFVRCWLCRAPCWELCYCCVILTSALRRVLWTAHFTDG